MKFALLCAAALLTAPAFADEVVASNGSDSVRLSNAPCSSELVLNRLKPQFRTVLRDAMTADRPYRRALAPNAAREEIRASVGGQFDERVASAFLEAMGR